MNIDRSKHNKYTTNAVYGNLTTGGIATDETGNVSSTGLQYSGNIIYIGGGGGGGIDPNLMDQLINQNAYSYLNISNGVYTVNASAKQLKDYINLNITGDNETVETLVSKDTYLNKTYYDATGLKGGRYSVAYKKVLVPGESGGEPVEIPKWVITLLKESGLPIFANTDFNGVQVLNNDAEVGVYSIDNPIVTVNSDTVTGLISVIISNPEPIDFTELRIIKAGDYINESTYSNIAIIKDIVIQEYITVTITQAGATKYWLIDDLGRLFTTYDTYTTKSLGAYDKIWTNYGYTVGNYTQGISGGAFYIVDDLLNTYLEVDKLKVRKKAYFETLEIVNVNSVGGKLIISPAGAVTLNKVEDKGAYYRCYFLGLQDGVEVENRFKKDDLAFSLNFNIKKPGEYELVANHYFWRKVNAVSTDPDVNGNHWIDLDKIDCDIDSDIPHVNDVVAQLGNKTDTDRLSAMIFSSVDAESPRIILCHGINTYSLSSKEYFDLGVNHLTNQAYMNVYGNSFVGARDGSTYVKYTLADGLLIKGSISASSTFGGKTFSEVFVTTENFDDSVKAVVGDELEYLLNLIDGNIESYFYDYSPTTTNYPANTWTTEAEKQRHNGDTFTNIQKFVSDITTPDAGKSWRWIKNASNVWGWTPISDSDAVLALKKAGEALDTADGKRRVFTRKPETADVYDIGDLWVNATYIDTVGLEVYSNDLLRAKKAKVKGIAFNITDWELASKYTDDTLASDAKALAEAALLAATDAGLAANTALTTINDYKDTIDDVFQDGIITASEKNRLNNLKDTVNTTLFDVQTTYNKVYNNTNLDGKVLKTRLKTAYDAFYTAANTLVTAVTTILNKVTSLSYSITKGDIATVDNAYTNFNTKYTDYVGALGDANLEITTSISSTAYTNAVNKYAWLNGLFDPDLTTTIEGGVVTTGVLALGKTTSGTFKVNAGINGVSNASYIGSGPAIWFGGDMLDKDNYSAGNRPANVATSMFRFDGSGYLGYKPNSIAAKDLAPIWWDATGNIHANPLSFFVGEETVGLLLASFLAVDNTGDGKVDYVILKAPFTFILIGNGYIGYDSATNSIYVYVLDSSGNKLMCNFYASGEVTAYGAGTSDPPISVLYLDELKDVLFTSLVANLLMQYNGSKWVNIDPSTIATKIDSLGDITDVTLTSIAVNDIIKWDGTKWVNAPYSGGGSSAWADITGKPTTIAGYGITDALSTSVANSTYVLKTGDTITGSLAVNSINVNPIIARSNNVNGSYIQIAHNGDTGIEVGWYIGLGAYLQNDKLTALPTLCLGRIDSITEGLQFRSSGNYYNVLHAGNYTNYPSTKLDTKKFTNASDINWTYQQWIANGDVSDISSMSLAALLQIGNSFSRGWQLWNSRNEQTIKWRPANSGGTAWDNVHILLDNINYDSYAVTLNSPQSITADKKITDGANSLFLSAGGNITIDVTTPGGWARGFEFYGNSTLVGKFGAYGGGSKLQYIYIGDSYDNTWFNINRNEPTFTVTGNAVNVKGAAGDLGFRVQRNTISKSYFGWNTTYGTYMYSYPSASKIHITDSGIPAYNGYPLLHSNNYNSYAPSLTGVGASGTWGINITGTATGLSTTSPVLATSYENNEIVVANNTGVSSLNHAIKFRWYSDYYQIGIKRGGLSSADGFTIWENSIGELLLVNKTAAYYKGVQLASITDNVASATKLQTARSIWGQNFDGTANITNTLTVAGNVNSLQTIGVALFNYNNAGGKFNEGIRIGKSTNGWSNIQFGAANAWNGYQAGQWCVGRNPSNYFVIGYTPNQSENGNWKAGNVMIDVNGHIYTNDIISAGRINTNYTVIVSTSWTNILQTPATIAMRADAYVATNTSQLMLGWQNVITNVGYRTTYRIGSSRGTTGYGEMVLFVGGSDAQNTGNSLSIPASGETVWTGGGMKANGVFKSVARGITSTFGALNTNYCHIYTTAPSFYMDKGLSVNGIISRSNVSITGTLYSSSNIESGNSITAAGEITAYSDIRLKSNISNLTYRGKLTPKVYTKDNKRSIGFIAQEVLVLYPELVIESNDENHYLSLNYGCITAVLSSLINIIDDEVTVLKKQVNSLLLEVVELRKELSLLS